MTDKEKAETSSEDTNLLVNKFQLTQQQLQGLLMQKETMSINKIEIERAMEELDKTTEKTAYKITGNVMISKPVADIKKELEETKEAIDIRLKGFEKNEKRLIEELKDTQEKLKKIMG